MTDIRLTQYKYSCPNSMHEFVLDGDTERCIHCFPMNSLREALRDILFRAAGGIHDMADVEIDSILATVSKYLPEKSHIGKQYSTSVVDRLSYNTAIIEMEKMLGGSV